MRQAIVSPKWNAPLKVKTPLGIATVRDLVLDAQRPIPDSRPGWDAGADGIHRFRRALPRPGAIGVFVDARLVRDFQMVKAIIRMRATVIAVGVRQKVQLADIGAVITVRLQNARQRQQVLRRRNTHPRDAEAGGIAARQHADAAGHTDRVLHEMMREGRAGSGKRVEIRRQYLGIAVGAQGIPALLVRVQNEDIRPSHRLNSRRMRAGRFYRVYVGKAKVLP